MLVANNVTSCVFREAMGHASLAYKACFSLASPRDPIYATECNHLRSVHNLSSVRLAASTTTEYLKRASGSINNNLWKRYEVILNTKNLCCQFSRMALKRGHFIDHMLCNWRASFDYFSGCDIRDNEALYISLHSIYLLLCSYAFIDVLLYWNANEEKTTRPIETATVLLNVSY